MNNKDTISALTLQKKIYFDKGVNLELDIESSRDTSEISDLLDRLFTVHRTFFEIVTELFILESMERTKHQSFLQKIFSKK